MSAEPVRAYRYALYFAPEADSPWWQAGSRWLGRCAVRQQIFEPPEVAGLKADEFLRLTAAPRRYGWHATLKAPFALTDGVTPAQLRAAVRALCRQRSPFAMPALRVSRLDDFLALTPEGEPHALHDVARACVTELHPLAAPLPPEELQRRRAGGLSPEEDALLLRWGYPFVLDRFRFHLSLTGSLRGIEPAVIEALQAAAQQWFAPLPPCRFETVALFAEPAPGADFMLLEHARLGA